MKKVFKKVLKNTVIYSLVLGLLLSDGLVTNLSSIIENNIAYAEDTDNNTDKNNSKPDPNYTSYDNELGVSQKEPSRIPLKVSLYRNEEIKLLPENGMETVYKNLSDGVPNYSEMEGTMWLTHYKSNFSLVAYEYNPSDGSFTQNYGANIVDLGKNELNSWSGEGCYLHDLVNFTEANMGRKALKNDAWKYIVYTAGTEKAKTAWHYIVSGSGKAATNKRIRQIYNPSLADWGNIGNWTDSQRSVAWHQYLDMLISLWVVSGEDPSWEKAVNDFINGSDADSIGIILEAGGTMATPNSGQYCVATVTDVYQFLGQVDAEHAINAEGWKSVTRSSFGNTISMITEATNETIANETIKRERVHIGNKRSSYAVASWDFYEKRMKLNKNKTSVVWGDQWTGYAGNLEIIGVAPDASYTETDLVSFSYYSSPSVSPSVPEFGALVALPDDKQLKEAIIDENISLSVIANLDEMSLGEWSLIVNDAELLGKNFIVTVEWEAACEDITGYTKIIVPDPTVMVWSPAEMREWVFGRTAIMAIDKQLNKALKPDKMDAIIEYKAHVTIVCGEDEYTADLTDTASFKSKLERIGYTSTPQAYTEFKNYGVNSNTSGTLSEDWEAMAGVPSTEQMYFAAGGSEFIVDVTLNEINDETAYRAYDYYYTGTSCEFKEGDKSLENWTVPSGPGSGDYSLNVHNGDLTVSCTIQGSIGNDAVAPAPTLHSSTCPAIPNAGDLAERASLYSQLTAWYNSVGAFVISHTAASDGVTRTTSISAVGNGNLPSCPSNVPQDKTDDKACSYVAPSGSIATGDYDPGKPCGNEMAQAQPDGAASWSVTATWTIPHHVICGPCCEHELPEIHDTWNQSVEYDTMEINDVHVWRIDQGAIEGLTDIINVDLVGASIVKGTPNIFYNIALKNNSNYKTWGAAITKSGYSKATLSSTVGRIDYSYERDKLDVIDECLGTRENKCDGLAKTTDTNVNVAGGNGHNEHWATGIIYTGSNEGSKATASRKGSTAKGETASLLNPRTTETGGQNYVTINSDTKDKATKEYAEFVKKRDMKNEATMVTDFLILQTSSGDQSVMYYQQKSAKTVYVDEQFQDIEIGALGPNMGSTKGGSITQKCWLGNPLSAANWTPYHIGLGSYTGKYWTGSSKFDGTSGGQQVVTKFDTKPANSLVMARPGRQNKLMIYTGELNIKLSNQNKSYTTGYSEVFWSNQLHWCNKNYTRLDKTGKQIKPYSSVIDMASIAPYATNITSFKSNASSKYTYSGAGSKDKYQFSSKDYVKKGGYALEAVYAEGYSKCNDIIIHDPVSTEHTALVSLPAYRDQRTADVVKGGAADLIDKINNSEECPEEPGLCDYRVLNCHYNEEVLMLNCDFDTQDSSGNFINKVTGNGLKLPAGFSLAKNNSFTGVALSAFGTRLSIPFEELGLAYNSSTHLRIETDIIVSPNGTNQMLFSFNSISLYLPAKTETGLDGNQYVCFNTGNGWEKKVNIPLADGRKHHIVVDMAMSGAPYCSMTIDGTKAGTSIINVSNDVDATDIGNALNIGSWGLNDNYKANFWLDNLKVYRQAGGTTHTDECYVVTMNHPDGLNAHRHTEDCLANTVNTITGMEVKEENGYTWGRVFYHDTAGGLFKNAAEALDTYSTYKFSILNKLQDIKTKKESKYVFMLYYPETGQKNIWKQSNRPQDESIADGGGTVKVTGYEPISIGMSGNYWGGLAKSTVGQTLIDGSVNHSNWWYSIGAYSYHGSTGYIPGGNDKIVKKVELWMAIDESYSSTESTVFNYTGNYQTYTIPANGYYKLEAWGASGGVGYGNANLPGRGGYTAGTTYFTKGTKLYIYVGEAGKAYNVGGASWNGGGTVFSGDTVHKGGGGGGASDIRLVSGNWNNADGLKSRILVAGGGGGAQSTCGGSNTSPGHGGGLTGANSVNNGGAYSNNIAYGGSQTSGGGYRLGNNYYNNGVKGYFGAGAPAGTCASGGGSGYYGGGSLYTTSGGGGSSYVSRYPGCDTTYLPYQGNYEFTDVVIQQGTNGSYAGNGKVAITRMSTVLDDIMDGLRNGTMTEEELRTYLGNAYDYMQKATELTTLKTYSDWCSSSNGFYDLAADNIEVNSDGSFMVETVDGWEFGMDTSIDGAALEKIEIIFKKDCEPDGSTELLLNNSIGTGDSSYDTNDNGEKVAVIDLSNIADNVSINNIWFNFTDSNYDEVTVKQINFIGYGSSSTKSTKTLVASSSTPGVYDYRSNQFGAATYNISLTGAGGGDARTSNATGLVDGSGGKGAIVTGEVVLNPSTNMTFIVGGKGQDQASTDQVGGYSSTGTVVANLTSAGIHSVTLTPGKYLLEAYGAGGASDGGGTGGQGGYSKGYYTVYSDTTVYVCVGGAGATSSGGGGGYNGGGNAGASGSSGGGGGATHFALNQAAVLRSTSEGNLLLVAGGGGGAGNSGNGGTGNSGGGASYGQGGACRASDGGGGGGGYTGGIGANGDVGGNGGTGYASTLLTDTSIQVGGGSGTSSTGRARITKYNSISGTPTDGFGGFNGGGNGGTEFGEANPESGAGGGGSTDLRIGGSSSTTYGASVLWNKDSSTAVVENEVLKVTTTNNYNVYRGGDYARKAGDVFLVTWNGTGLNDSRITVDGGIYDGVSSSFQKGRGVIVHSVKKSANQISAIYICTEKSKKTEFRLQTGGAQITLKNKVIKNMTNQSKVLIAGGGGGAASGLNSALSYGGNGGAWNGSATNDYTAGGTQSSGYSYGLGQNGNDGVRANNYGAIAGGGAGYYGGSIVKENTTTAALGGAGGSSYYNSGVIKKATATVASDNTDGSYALYEMREKLIITKTNFDADSVDLLMKYYTAIPDKLPNGSDNPIWENCDKSNNYHKCNSNCTSSKTLVCSEPHHKGLHYDISNDMCWDACMNDAKHKIETGTVLSGIKDVSFTPGTFINLDYGFSIYFPDMGNFEEGQVYGIGGLSSAKGKGYTNVYTTAKPYDRGTVNAANYSGKDVGMNTAKWTRTKKIKFTIDVIYKDKLYLAGEWIMLGDRGRYNGSIGGIGNTPAKGKYDETKWSNYGSELYEGIYEEYYDFYCVLENNEARGASYTVEVTSLNCSSFNGTGYKQANDNKDNTTNKGRSSAFFALHGGTNHSYFDVVGRIGNLIMEDVEDFRFSNLFKEAVSKSDAANLDETKKFTVKNGLSLKDSMLTANAAEIDGNYVKTNSIDEYVSVTDYDAEKAYYKVEVYGKGLNAGRLSIVNNLLDIIVPDEQIELITQSSTKVAWYVDLSEDKVDTLDIKYISKGSTTMTIESILITKLGESPDTWLLDGIVSDVDESKQNIWLGWVSDIRGIKVSKQTKWLNTWGALTWMDSLEDKNKKDLPLSPEKNNIEILRDEPMLTGYAALMDIQTIGNYFYNDTCELQIIPRYYAIDIVNDMYKLIPLDIYMEHDGTYEPINLFDNINKTGDSVYKEKVYNNVINLDWSEEQVRRNYTDEEKARTMKVYERTAHLAGTDDQRPIDIPGGHITTLGNNQYLKLNGTARTFVGASQTYNMETNPGNRINETEYIEQAQRWHFSIGLPSSTVFVKQDKPITSGNIVELTDGNYIVLCALNIKVVGTTFALEYKHKYSGSQIATITESNKSIIKGWTDSGTTGGEYMGMLSVVRPDTGTSLTIDLNKFAKEVDYDPIVFVYNPSMSSGQDVEIIGTH